MNLQQLVVKRCWSPRNEFPPSQLLSDRLFSCGDGLYLRTNPRYGDDDPVYAVGWAESDYWAMRAWHVPFLGGLTPPPPRWDGPPSLQFAGRPGRLSFGSVRDFERAQPGARIVTLESAQYRLTDGAFLSCVIEGTGGITYFYGSNAPKTDDQPVALEFSLPEPK